MSPCRCEGFVHPGHITNPPSLASIDYRVGEFLEFRHALLLSRPGEQHLAQWHPGGEGDLAVQMVEWWAYLADILTFYNERTATQAFLGTADDDEAVRNLVRILGYRPRPGLAAHAILAAILSGREATLPRGLQFETKPPPGKKPQTFELDATTTIALPDMVPAELAADDTLFALGGVLLRGTGTDVTRDEQLLLISRDTTQKAFVTVTGVRTVVAPDGRKNTLAEVSGAGALPGAALATDYRLLRSTQSARPRRGSGALSSTSVHLDSLYRDITTGSPLVFRGPGTAATAIATGIGEGVYYANSAEATPLTPPAAPEIAIAVPATIVTYAATTITSTAAQTTVLFRWIDAGEVIAAPRATSAATSPIEVVVEHDDRSAFAAPLDLLVEDANGKGSAAHAVSGGETIALSGLSAAALPLTAPLKLLFNRLDVSRGKSVAGEVLGSGDATLPGQDFTLRNAPVTYLQDSKSLSGENYSSSIRLRVNGIEWHEVQSFFEQKPDARIFVTVEDAEGKTHVKTGDGINGTRLPSGVDNVVASYRYGSGEDAPAAGTLTVVTKSFPGLRSVRNPVAAGGGADPDPASRLRELAPRSVLTFGRAVSAADYEAIAASAPGVDRVRAYWSFNAVEQRAMLTLYVGDEETSADAARAAIAGAGESDDAIVKPASPIPLGVTIAVVVDPDFEQDAVGAQVATAITDPVNGVFGSAKSRIGRTVYRSAVYAACLAVPGVVAIRQLFVTRNDGFFLWSFLIGSHRYVPGEGGYFVVEDLSLSTEAPDVH
jgi:hypothetical protein